MEEKVRIGLVGCGGNMRSHLKRRLKLIPEVEILAICDPVRENIERAISENPEIEGAKKYSDHMDMLESVELDATIISTPHTLHYNHIKDSLEHDLHVLVEKPMVCSVDEAKDVIALRDRKKRILMVSYQRHYSGPYRYCREAISSGRMGRVEFISAYQCQDWYANTGKGWRTNLSLSGGGQLNDSGSHMIDILLWVTGLQTEEVFAYIDNLSLEVDVLSAISLRFRGGAMGNISIVGKSIREFDEEVNFWCENGVLQVKSISNPVLTVWDPEEREIPPDELEDSSTPDRNFINAILGREEIQVPAECGLRTIELTEAAWESGRSGKTVKVKT